MPQPDLGVVAVIEFGGRRRRSRTAGGDLPRSALVRLLRDATLGGPNLAAYVGRASRALGSCRRSEPYIEALRCEDELGSPGPAVAALGVLDNREACTALTRCLQCVLRGESGTSYSAAEAAILRFVTFPYVRLVDKIRKGESGVLE